MNTCFMRLLLLVGAIFDHHFLLLLGLINETLPNTSHKLSHVLQILLVKLIVCKLEYLILLESHRIKLSRDHLELLGVNVLY